MENVRRRQVGAIGTAARVVLGLSLLVSGVLEILGVPDLRK